MHILCLFTFSLYLLRNREAVGRILQWLLTLKLVGLGRAQVVETKHEDSWCLNNEGTSSEKTCGLLAARLLPPSATWGAIRALLAGWPTSAREKLRCEIALAGHSLAATCGLGCRLNEPLLELGGCSDRVAGWRGWLGSPGCLHRQPHLSRRHRQAEALPLRLDHDVLLLQQLDLDLDHRRLLVAALGIDLPLVDTPSRPPTAAPAVKACQILCGRPSWRFRRLGSQEVPSQGDPWGLL